MESKAANPDRRHYYDANMSRRTRKRTTMLHLKEDPVIITVSSGHEDNERRDRDKESRGDDEEKEKISVTKATNTNAREEDQGHNSEQLTMMMDRNGSCNTNAVRAEVDQASHKGRSSLGQHLNNGGGKEEDKKERDGQLEVVTLIKHEPIKRPKGMVSQCVRLLNHLVKIKPRRKHLLQLTM